MGGRVGVWREWGGGGVVYEDEFLGTLRVKERLGFQNWPCPLIKRFHKAVFVGLAPSRFGA